MTATCDGTAVEVVGVDKAFAVRGLLPGRPKSVVHALRCVDLSVPAATVHGVMGPNGSGKSTLLRILATLVVADEGRAVVAGFDVERNANGVRRSIGFSTGDDRSLYWRLTAEQNLEFVAALYRIRDVRGAVGRALRLVDLEDERSRPVSGFSQGMARRLGLARALLHAPPVLLLDEPTRSLDPAARHEFHRVVSRLRAEGVTTVLVTHDAQEATSLCDRVSVLAAGRFVDDVDEPRDAGALEAAVEQAGR